jgi:chemotaxis receptor (MCP) glutamine deamidase CheD
VVFVTCNEFSRSLWPGLYCFYGLNVGMILLLGLCVHVCLYDTSMLASMTHLCATVPGILFPVTTSRSVADRNDYNYRAQQQSLKFAD